MYRVALPQNLKLEKLKKKKTLNFKHILQDLIQKIYHIYIISAVS